MTLEQIKYVLEVARCGSINKAAANLIMTQSALSQSIQSVEAYVGSPIFLRTNKGVILTPFGSDFIESIKPIENQLNQVNERFSRQISPELVFNYANDGFVSANILSCALYYIYKDRRLRINAFESFDSVAINYVSQRLAEVGVMRIWDTSTRHQKQKLELLGLEFHTVYEAPLAVTVGPGNPLYHDKSLEYVTTDMLEGFPQIERAYDDYSLLPESLRAKSVPLATTSKSAANDFLIYSDAYTLGTSIPKNLSFKRTVSYKRTIPIKDLDITSKIGWIKNKGSVLNEVAETYIDLLESWYKGEIREEDLFK